MAQFVALVPRHARQDFKDHGWTVQVELSRGLKRDHFMAGERIMTKPGDALELRSEAIAIHAAAVAARHFKTRKKDDTRKG